MGDGVGCDIMNTEFRGRGVCFLLDIPQYWVSPGCGSV